MELRRGGSIVTMSCPTQCAVACGVWLLERCADFLTIDPPSHHVNRGPPLCQEFQLIASFKNCVTTFLSEPTKTFASFSPYLRL